MTTTLDKPTESTEQADALDQTALNDSAANDTTTDEPIAYDPFDETEVEPPETEPLDPEADPDPAEDDDPDPEADPEPDSEDDPDPATDEDPEPDFSEIPKEHHAVVGKLIAKSRRKALAKSEARIAELTETANAVPALEKERDALQEQIESIKASKSVPAPTESDPYAHITDVADLQSTEDALWAHRRALMTDPDAVQIPTVDGGKRYLEEGEAKERLALVDERLQRYLPAKRAALERHAQEDAALVKEYPEIDREGTPLKRAINKVLAEQPTLKLKPGYRRVALAQALGEKLLAEKGKDAWAIAQGKAPAVPRKTAVKKVATRRAPPPPRAASAPRRSGPTNTQGKFSEDAFDEELGF